MHLKHLLVAPAAIALIGVAGMPPASAGEVTGSGNPTQGPAHANSICGFSGLEDGDDDDDGLPDPGAEYGPGATPQNWGHVRQFLTGQLGLTPAQIKASGESPGDSCNGHTGFLAGGGGEPPA